METIVLLIGLILMVAIILISIAFVLLKIIQGGLIGILIALAMVVVIISLSGGEDGKYG